jgi:hypothetical protein
MVLQLKENIAVFSAFKSHVQQSAFHKLLVDENGKQRSFAKFRQEAMKIDKQYNQQWLSAEFNLATRQARSAKQWQGFVANKELYPNLRYMPSRSAEPRDAHRVFYDKVFAIDDPIWNTLMPPVGWGCKCWVQPTRDDAPTYDGIEAPLETPGIAGNSGKTGRIITATHPYITQTSAPDKAEIKKQLPILRSENVEILSVPVGTNSLLINTLADQKDILNNVEFITPFIKRYKKDFGVREHTEKTGTKNPELYSYNIIGDRTQFDGEKIRNYVNNSFKKLKEGGQLAKEKTCFIGLDLLNKLKHKDIGGFAGKLLERMKPNRDNLKFILIKNGDKVVKIDNTIDLTTKELSIIIKGELL